MMKRSRQKEMMDLPCTFPAILEQDLANLRIINRYLGGYRGVIYALDRFAGEQKMNRLALLDVGTGSGDIPALIALWARKKRVSARLVALESESVTVNQAAQQTRAFPEITVVRGDGTAPPFPAASFDFVLASQFLHHFSEDQIIAFLRTWSQVARRAIIVSDLIRHPLAYYGILGLTRIFTRNVMTLTDAPLSVQRAFTMAEWRELFCRADVGTVQLFSVFPFRVIALVSLRADHAGI